MANDHDSDADDNGCTADVGRPGADSCSPDASLVGFKLALGLARLPSITVQHGECGQYLQSECRSSRQANRCKGSLSVASQLFARGMVML